MSFDEPAAPSASKLLKHVYYPSLDGLRTIAVGIVLCAHGGIPYFRSGGTGVDVFFVLSGFLITTILITEHARTGGINFRNFYARRFLRLAPALLLTCVVAAAGMVVFEHRFPGTEVALSLSYTANWAIALYDYHLTWLNHCWSLSIEEQFYMIWPLIILGLERSIRSPRRKILLLIGGAALIAIYRALNVGVYTDNRINFGLDTRMDTLMVGAALAYFAQMRSGRGVSEAVSKGLGRILAPLALAGIFAVINIVTWYSPWMGWIGYVLVASASMVVIADLVLGRHSVLAPLLAWRPMVFIGRISYGLYLLHLPVYYMVDHVLAGQPLAIRLPCKVVISVTLAAASYHLMERYFLKLKDRFESRMPAKSEVVAERVVVIR